MFSIYKAMKFYETIIIGSGMTGLYSAYKLKKSHQKSFLILEKSSKNGIGGRAGNDTFYGANIVTGAGIGRSKKDKLLLKLMKDFNFPINKFTSIPHYAKSVDKIDINKKMKLLKRIYKKNKNLYKKATFKAFASKILGKNEYKKFVVSSGYRDYEKEDIHETLYNYGMDDNACCLQGFSVPWKKLVMKMYEYIGKKHFKFSSDVIGIKRESNQYKLKISTGRHYMCNNIIVATTIDTVRRLFPHNKIYKEIEGQPFIRLYAKFSQKSIPIMKEYIKGYTVVEGTLQKIIPMNVNKGVYMIVYNDNKNSIALKKHLKNTEGNRKFYVKLLEKSLGIPKGLISIHAIKDYYWKIGTHYYKPLNESLYKNRGHFIEKAQHPADGIMVVGELLSENQGWVEGALESVENAMERKKIDFKKI